MTSYIGKSRGLNILGCETWIHLLQLQKPATAKHLIFMYSVQFSRTKEFRNKSTFAVTISTSKVTSNKMSCMIQGSKAIEKNKNSRNQEILPANHLGPIDCPWTKCLLCSRNSAKACSSPHGHC